MSDHAAINHDRLGQSRHERIARLAVIAGQHAVHPHRNPSAGWHGKSDGTLRLTRISGLRDRGIIRIKSRLLRLSGRGLLVALRLLLLSIRSWIAKTAPGTGSGFLRPNWQDTGQNDYCNSG